MAVKSKDYFNELKKHHELEESLSVEELEKRSLSVNPNILEASNKTEEAKKYAQMLGAAFDSYVVSWLKPEDYKENEINRREYEFSIKTGIKSFFDLFEGFMNLKFKEDPKNAGKERQAREGLSVNDLKMILANQARKYATVPDIWAEKIKNGTYDMEQIKKVTDAAYNWAHTHDNSEAEKPSFETTAHAYEAMQKIVASRSRLWRFWIWNWNQDRKEQDYLNALKSQVEEINAKFDNVVANIIAQEKEKPCVKAYGDFLDAEIKNEMLEDREARITEFEEQLKDKIAEEKREFETQKAEEAERQRAEEQLKKEEEERVAKARERQDKIDRGLTLEVKFEEITSAENFKKEMIDEIVKDIPEIAGLPKDLQKKFFDQPFDSILMKSVQEELAKFTAEGVDKQAQMREMAKAVFVASNTCLYKIGYMADPADRLAAAQILTDKIMSKLSPAAMEPDKYTVFEKGYFLAHPVTTNEFLPKEHKIGEEFLNDSYAKANKTYGELTGNAKEIQEFAEVKQPEPKVEAEEELEGYEDRTDNVYFIDEEGDVSYDPFGKGEAIFVPNLSNAFEVGDPNSYAVHEEVVEGDEEEIKEEIEEGIEEKAEEQVEEEQPAPVEEKEVPISEKLGAILNQENFTEIFADGLAQKLPSGLDLTNENKNIQDAKKRLLSAKSLKELGEKLDGLNKKFDEGKEAGKDVKALMQEYMKGVIPEAKELMSGMTIPYTTEFRLKDVSDGQYRVITPYGYDLFKTQGSGLQYVHGGSSLQEIIVPVVHISELRSNKQKDNIRPVGVRLKSITRKITNRSFSLDFEQYEKVEDKKQALGCETYFVNEDGLVVSNVCKFVANSTSDDAATRVTRIRFTLKNVEFDRNKRYFLILKNAEKQDEFIEREQFTIDILSFKIF